MQASAQRLLVVEDDVDVARALSRTLARRGFAVAVARSCTAARSFDEPFDFAVLDLDLPDGNGVDLASQLLDDGTIPNVVFFTGSRDPVLLARARELGSVVVKSSGTTTVLALIAPDEHSAPSSQTALAVHSRRSRAASGAALIRKSRTR